MFQSCQCYLLSFPANSAKTNKGPMAYAKLTSSSYCCCWEERYTCTHNLSIWTASSEFGTYRLCKQQRFRRACASAQSRQNLHCSLIQAVSQEEPSDRKPDPWPLWMAGHTQLKCVMTECSKTQIRLTGLIYYCNFHHYLFESRLFLLL